MKAVSNSSPLIALSSIGRLELVHRRFPEGILIPRAVWREVVETGHGKAGAQRVSESKWIEVCDCKAGGLLDLLRLELDEGESEAIVLSLETKAPMILLDEKAARQIARRMRLSMLGTVGLLIWAKQQREIPLLKPELDLLMSMGKFRIGADVYQWALQAAGE